MISMEAVIGGALDTLLWTSSCNGMAPGDVCDHRGRGEDCDASLDALNYDQSDFAAKARSAVEHDVRDFVMSNETDIAMLLDDGKASAEDIGYNFILTRNREGAGFWDRGWGECGQRLTEASRPYGEMSAYIGDDGKIYVA